MNIKVIILDAFGTCVEITRPTKPYARLSVGREVMKQNKSFDELTDDPFLKQQLEDELDSIRMFPDYPEFMNRVGTRPVAIGSNLATPYSVRLREVLVPEPDYFHLSCEVGAMKPERKFYYSILEHFGVQAEEVLMIGDSVRNDFMAPARLGIRSILVSRGIGMTLLDIADQRL